MKISKEDILITNKRRYKITDKQLADRCRLSRVWVNRVLNGLESKQEVFEVLEVMINEVEQNQLKTK